MQLKQLIKDTAYRPQSNFLPQAPKRGTMETVSQNPSKRNQKERKGEEKKATATAL